MRSATDASDRGTEGIERLLTPASIAIVGASGNPSSIGGKPLQLLQRLGYRGAVYPVNPKYRELAGIPCFPSIMELPEAPDLALVAVAASAVLETLTRLAERKTRSAVVFSGGFGETGADGERLQGELAALVERSGLRVLGPNCQGLVNLWQRVPATFSASADLST